MKTRTIVDNGFDGIVGEIECQISNGLPSIIIVGFANKAVDEAKERIRSAFTSSSIPFPKKRLTINLAPADVPKDNTSFDLAIAAAILQSAKTIKPLNNDCAFFGELGLDGEIRPVRGLIGKLVSAKKHGLITVYIPESNVPQAALIDGLQILPFKTLKDVYLHLSGATTVQKVSPSLEIYKNVETKTAKETDFSDIVGQPQAKRALTIAASGNHNILLNGPPGTGKSMLAKALVSVLPAMVRDEVLETTHIHSLHNKNYESIVSTRPFRSPHHSASDTSIIGGGRNPRPGEISLAHNGVLFFDELPEFKRNTIEALRQPLEDRVVTVSRAKDTVTFPANFILVATANPCPCGYFGTSKECSCTPYQLHQYSRKLSGPIMDRIDIYVNVENLEHKKLLEKNTDSENSESISKKISLAIAQQNKRFGKRKFNSDMTNRDIKQFSKLSNDARLLLDKGAEKLELSPRAYMRTLKVARTIADIEQSSAIESSHIAEALQYRPVRNIEA
jgi:magnesium chelatase family protein